MSVKLHSSQWKLQAKQLLVFLGSAEKDNHKIKEILNSLNAFVYPVELSCEDVERLLRCFVKQVVFLQSDARIQVAQLTYNLQTYHKESNVPVEVAVNLVDVFLSLLTSTNPPNELFYAAASLLSTDVIFKSPESFFKKEAIVMRMCVEKEWPVETQRGALHFVTALCENSQQLPRAELEVAVEGVLKSLSHSSTAAPVVDSRPEQFSTNSVLLQKLVLSKLRFLHACLPHLKPVSSSPSLALLLSSLKAHMMVGLSRDPPETLGCLRPPLALPRVPPPPPSALSTCNPSSPALPKAKIPLAAKSALHDKKQGQRKQKKGKGRVKGGEYSSSGEDSSTARLSSDGELSSGASTGDLRPTRYQRSLNSGNSFGGGAAWSSMGSRFKPRRGKGGLSSSESDVSDSEASRMKTVMCKMRLETHSCLALLFQLLDRHTSFSYWLSFLPDGPHPFHSPALLPNCIVKDPSPKCRGAAISVLSAMLDGSRPYLAAADDKPRSTQPFTPYSYTLGSVVRELHRVLLSAVMAEPQHSNCVLLLKALRLLMVNTTYQHLSNRYLTHITEVLEKMASHKDTQVQAESLSCCQVGVSLTPTHPDVATWLDTSAGSSTSCDSGGDGGAASLSSSSSSSPPWLFQHCLSLLQTQAPASVQVECLQVLAALARHCFSHIRTWWGQLRDVYFSHLVAFPTRTQPYVLKVVEELCRSLSSSDPGPDVVLFWEQLLAGPLTAVLQNYRELGQLASQACDTLSTIHTATLARLKRPYCMLALSLPVQLSGDESAPNSVNASAVRVLGVFVLFESLKDDDSFFLDCHSAVTRCLTSSNQSVRAQASWALANLADSLSSRPHLLTPHLTLSLASSVLLGLGDVDKVRCNAIRAAGNLLKQLQDTALPTSARPVQELGLQLASCVNTGSMKSRWNACYACHGALSNPHFVSGFSSSVTAIVSALCSAVHSCKNFKVRSNAATALSGAAKGSVLSTAQLLEVWHALWHALETSEQQEDFSEFKHAATLKEQLCVAICNFLLEVLSAGRVQDSEELFSHKLPETSIKHFTLFLTKSVLVDIDSDSSVGKDRHDLVKAVQDSLKKVVDCGDDIGTGLATVWNVFVKSFEKMDRGI